MPTDFYPMTAAQLYDRTLHVFKKSFWMQIAYAAMLGVISFFGFAVFGFVFAFALFTNNTNTGIFTTILAIGALGLLWLAASSAGHILLARQALYGHKAKIPVRQIPRVAMRVFFTLVAQIIAFVPLVGVTTIIIMPFTASAWGANFYLHFWTLLLLGFTIIVCFALYYNIFSLAIAVSVFERKTFFGALWRSWELIKGEFWRIAAIRLMWVLVAFALTFSIQGGLQLLTILMALSSDLLGLNLTTSMAITGMLSMVTMVLSFVVSIAAMPLEGVFSATLYFNQRIKKEGMDIEIALGRLRL